MREQPKQFSDYWACVQCGAVLYSPTTGRADGVPCWRCSNQHVVSVNQPPTQWKPVNKPVNSILEVKPGAVTLPAEIVRAINAVKFDGQKVTVEINTDNVREWEAFAAGRAGVEGQAEARATWQPIATAPKDGTPILLYCEHKSMVEGSWNRGGAMHMPHWSTPTPWFEPTHWRPRPDPPLAEGAGEP